MAAPDAVAATEDAATANLWARLLGNDADGDNLAIVGASPASALGGTVTLDAAAQSLAYAADAPVLDRLAPGETRADGFSYTVSDGHGGVSTAMASVTVTGVASGLTVLGGGGDVLAGTVEDDAMGGGAGHDTVRAGGGADRVLGQAGDALLWGGAGRDLLDGGTGADRLEGGGGAGADRLEGDGGHDRLWGGSGADVFRFEAGRDRVEDFRNNADTLAFDDALWGGGARSAAQIMSYAALEQGRAVFDFGEGQALVVEGVSSLASLADDVGWF